MKYKKSLLDILWDDFLSLFNIAVRYKYTRKKYWNDASFGHGGGYWDYYYKLESEYFILKGRN